MKLVTNSFLGLLILIQFASFAQGEKRLEPTEIEKVHQGIEKMNSETNSISSEFTQIKNLSFMAEKVESKGLFFFQKNDKIRWEYKAPTPYIIVINENRIYIDNNREKKSFDSNSGKGFKMLNKMIIKCMDGSISNDPDYEVNYYSDNVNYRISLIPKSKNLKSFVKEINLFLDGTDFTVNSIKLLESDAGDYTFIRFEHRKYNQQIDPSIFSGF